MRKFFYCHVYIISQAHSKVKLGIELKPANHTSFLIRGMIFYDSGDYNNAIGDFNKSLELSPENPLLKCYIALTKLRTGEDKIKAQDTLLKEIPNANSEFKARLMVFCESYLLKQKEKSRFLDDMIFYEEFLDNPTFKPNFIDNFFYTLCMSSKGFGQIKDKNKRGFQVPNTFSWMFKQPLKSDYPSCAEALSFS